jgi:hypothetical protein
MDDEGWRGAAWRDLVRNTRTEPMLLRSCSYRCRVAGRASSCAVVTGRIRDGWRRSWASSRSTSPWRDKCFGAFGSARSGSGWRHREEQPDTGGRCEPNQVEGLLPAMFRSSATASAAAITLVLAVSEPWLRALAHRAAVGYEGCGHSRRYGCVCRRGRRVRSLLGSGRLPPARSAGLSCHTCCSTSRDPARSSMSGSAATIHERNARATMRTRK